MSSKRILTILFNAMMPGLHGGQSSHDHLLQKTLNSQCNILPFNYTRRMDDETLFLKIVDRYNDLRQVDRLIKSSNPDLIHLNTAHDSRAIIRDLALSFLARKRKVPLFIKLHGGATLGLDDLPHYAKVARAILLRNAHSIGLLSPVEKEEFYQHWPQYQHKFLVTKNFIPSEFFDLKRAEESIPTILFISRIQRRKGVFDLLDAVPLVISQVPNVRFWFVGSGEDDDEFDRELRMRKFEHNVTKFSHVEHLHTQRFYSKAWMLVFPTHYPEGMPMVVAEGMASGIPIITTPARFCRSYLDEGKHCLFTPIGDPTALAQKIVRLINDRELRENMSSLNRAQAAAFRLGVVASEYVTLYESISQLHG